MKVVKRLILEINRIKKTNYTKKYTYTKAYYNAWIEMMYVSHLNYLQFELRPTIYKKNEVNY